MTKQEKIDRSRRREKRERQEALRLRERLDSGMAALLMHVRAEHVRIEREMERAYRERARQLDKAARREARHA